MSLFLIANGPIPTTAAQAVVTDETSDQVLTSGGTFNVPAWTYDVNQPT